MISSSKPLFRPTRLIDGQFHVSPAFVVPSSIPRPPLSVFNPKPILQKKSKSEVDVMRKPCAIAASALLAAKKVAQIGVTTDEVDKAVSEYIVSRGAYPSGIGFMGFPKSICVSINEVIAHGIPDSRPLQDGDIVNFDITCWKDGYYGDCSAMVEIGTVDDEAKRLIRSTKEAMHAAIAACLAGSKLSVIPDEITKIANRDKFHIVDYFAGHFIGKEMHLPPNVVHFDPARSLDEFVLEQGHVFTVEPIFSEFSTHSRKWKDRWTYATVDGGWTAQWEHVVHVTGSGPPEILTLPDDLDAGVSF